MNLRIAAPPTVAIQAIAVDQAILEEVTSVAAAILVEVVISPNEYGQDSCDSCEGLCEAFPFESSILQAKEDAAERLVRWAVHHARCLAQDFDAELESKARADIKPFSEDSPIRLSHEEFCELERILDEEESEPPLGLLRLAELTRKSTK